MGIIKKVGGPAIPPAQLSPTNKAGAKSAAQVIDSSVVGRMQGRSIPATLSFSGLFSEKSKATFILKTKDKELVGERKSLFDDDKGYVPETLNGIPEANFIWDFINNPSSDLSQILQRQTLLTTLLNSDSLEQLMQVKNEAYKLCRGVSALFKTVDVSGYGNYEPLLTAYKRGNDQYEDEVMRALDMIESGKESLVALLPLLKSVSPALMGDIVSTLSDHLMNVDHFNRDFFSTRMLILLKSRV